jgi:hypothetical protein
MVRVTLTNPLTITMTSPLRRENQADGQRQKGPDGPHWQHPVQRPRHHAAPEPVQGDILLLRQAPADGEHRHHGGPPRSSVRLRHIRLQPNDKCGRGRNDLGLGL